MNIPTETLIGRLEKKLPARISAQMPQILSCLLYANINDSNFEVEFSNDTDSYYSEIMFLIVDINDKALSDVPISGILRAIGYQTVLELRCGGEFCLAAGLIRQARDLTKSKKMMEYCQTPWMKQGNCEPNYRIDTDELCRKSFEKMYESIYETLSQVTEELPLGNINYSVF